jgi:hypothetical protein
VRDRLLPLLQGTTAGGEDVSAKGPCVRHPKWKWEAEDGLPFCPYCLAEIPEIREILKQMLLDINAIVAEHREDTPDDVTRIDLRKTDSTFDVTGYNDD